MYPVQIAQLLLRFSGLIFYFLLFLVLVIRISRTRLAETLEKIIFPLFIVHPILYVAFNYLYGKGFNPYAGFVNICLLCDTPAKYYYSIGIGAFWILMITLFLVFKKWKYSHVLTYVVFFLVGIHGYFLGWYFRMQPYFTIVIVMYAVVLGLFIFRETPSLFKAFRNWVRS
jgi:hypothetical protein